MIPQITEIQPITQCGLNSMNPSPNNIAANPTIAKSVGIVAYRQWRAMLKSNNLTRQSADAAKESADAAVAASRPWIIPANSITYEPGGAHKKAVGLLWANVGKTVAMDVRGTSEHAIQSVHTPSLPQFNRGCPEPGDSGTSMLSYVLADQKPFQMFAFLPPEDAVYLIHGCIKYRDVLSNQTRITEFCDEVFKPPSMDTFLVGPSSACYQNLGFTGIRIR
jgi:hypothetical protein